MEYKKYVVRQNNWTLTPPLSRARAENEIVRLSEWFTGLEAVEVGQLEEESTFRREPDRRPDAADINRLRG